MLLVFGAPHKHRLLVGREHGRTIPLADIPDRNLLPQNVLGSSTVPIGKRVGAARPQFTPIWPRIAEAAALVGEELSSSFDIAASRRAAAERKGVAVNGVSEI